MSYLPLRDTFDLPDDATSKAVWGLIDIMDVEHRAGVHEDSCNCPDPDCREGQMCDATAEFALGWMLREGWITVEQIRTWLEDASAVR